MNYRSGQWIILRLGYPVFSLIGQWSSNPIKNDTFIISTFNFGTNKVPFVLVESYSVGKNQKRCWKGVAIYNFWRRNLYDIYATRQIALALPYIEADNAITHFIV